jgi:FkbM family methyltransferase
MLVRSGMLGRHAKLRLRALHLRELLLGPASRATLPVGPVRVHLGGTGDFAIDWKAFVEVLAREPYAADYRDARVLDVGAHKGYFGAFALSEGARAVVSYEPASANFRLLDRAAARLPQRWSARQAALGGSRGTGILQLDSTSWAHSLVRVERPAGSEEVTIVTLEDALAALPSEGARTVVKIDAEGSECEILTHPSALEDVDVLLVEWHAETASCSRDTLMQRIAAAGLELVDAGGTLHFERRTARDRSPSRSAVLESEVEA